MRRPLRSMVCSLLLVGGVARAEIAAPVLVLPTQLGGVVPDRAGWQREFDARMDRAVRKMGRLPRAPGPLTAAEATCRTAECMARLAEGAGTDIVIGARVVADKGSPPSYKLVVDRFDRDRPGAVRQEDAECSVCTETEAAERLEQITSGILPAVAVAPTVVVVPVEPAPVAPTGPVVVESPHHERNLKIAIAITSVFAAGGIGMIIAGAKGLSMDGDPVGKAQPGQQTPLLYDTHDGGTALVTTGAILTGAACIALGLETYALLRRRR